MGNAYSSRVALLQNCRQQFCVWLIKQFRVLSSQNFTYVSPHLPTICMLNVVFVVCEEAMILQATWMVALWCTNACNLDDKLSCRVAIGRQSDIYEGCLPAYLAQWGRKQGVRWNKSGHVVTGHEGGQMWLWQKRRVKRSKGKVIAQMKQGNAGYATMPDDKISRNRRNELTATVYGVHVPVPIIPWDEILNEAV